MCGIAGFSWEDKGLLREIARRIAHRGPDHEGYYTDKDISMVNRRLRIIDLMTGDQPISNEDENLWIVCNGEIYNFPELKNSLEKMGHDFQTKTTYIPGKGFVLGRYGIHLQF